jgi:hypothetical protein
LDSIVARALLVADFIDSIGPEADVISVWVIGQLRATSRLAADRADQRPCAERNDHNRASGLKHGPGATSPCLGLCEKKHEAVTGEGRREGHQHRQTELAAS